MEKGSLTKFAVVVLITTVAAELIGRVIATWLDNEPFYDANSKWLRVILIAPVVTWAFFRYGAIKRLRERGHIR